MEIRKTGADGKDLLLAIRERIESWLAAEHIRLALDAMAAIAGETVSDDVLSVIFGKFCVGK